MDIQYPSLEGLAPDSEAAQARQRQAVNELGLPLEVKTRQTGIVLRLIPPGTFTMGSPASEPGRDSNEGPQHQVTLTQAFYCGKFEVTQREWQAVMGNNPAYFKSPGLDAPVEDVNWHDCQTFLITLCQKEGVPNGTYRLLTEAEWEYACRAGSASAYYFGDNASILGDYAWYSDNSESVTHPVGQKKPNALGLYDMHGNVWEWCQDWYDSSYYSVSPGTDPLGPALTGYRVSRAGGWSYYAVGCRSAFRYWNSPKDCTWYVGLRLARTISSPSQLLPASLPDDLVDTRYPLLEGLAPGSQEAQDQQRQAIQQLGLPVEVRTRMTEIVLRLIPDGTFTMGSPTNEPGRQDGESPQHEVTLTKSFYCGKFEVTQGQWQAVMGTNPSHFPNAGLEAPVERVSWDDCQAFLTRLCQMEGVTEGTYRLLTEAEWEYACRAGTQTAVYNGELVILGQRNGPALDLIAWYGGNSGVEYEGAHDSSGWPEKQYNHTRAGTHPVGEKAPNAFGLRDMIGNAWEWCQDWYGLSYYDYSPATDPLGPASGAYRVSRGGDWLYYARECRSASRWLNPPVARSSYRGLRLARTIP